MNGENSDVNNTNEPEETAAQQETVSDSGGKGDDVVEACEGEAVTAEQVAEDGSASEVLEDSIEAAEGVAEEELQEEGIVEEEAEPEVIYLPPTEEEYEGLLTKLSGFEQEIQSLTTRLRSLSNAYHNKEKEVESAKERIKRNASRQDAIRRGEVVKVLFEPLENLNRSIEVLEKAGVEESHVDGLKMVQKAFLTGFHSLGLEEVPGKGARFNPNYHAALMNQPVLDPALHEVVVQVYSTGYLIGDLTLRPSQVIVGQYTAPIVEEVEEVEEIKEADKVEEVTEADEVILETIDEAEGETEGSESTD